MKTLRIFLLPLLFVSTGLLADGPPLINYQGRVAVNGANFEGSGQFKFALVNANGSQTFWSNDGTSVNGSEPSNAVPLSVAKGLYSVLLGDSAVPNMDSLPASIFINPEVRLRVWFDDGMNGSQLLTPDQRLAPTPYLARGSVTSDVLANGAVLGGNIAAGAVSGIHVANGSLDFSQLNVPAPPGPGQVLGFDGQSLVWQAAGGGGNTPWTQTGNGLFYNGGRVGIGTSNPAATLELSGFNGNTLFRATAPVPNLILQDTSANATSVIGASSGGLRFYANNFWTGTNSAALMSLDADGRLGVGTATPSQFFKVDVAGGLQSQGDIRSLSRIDVYATTSIPEDSLLTVIRNQSVVFDVETNPNALYMFGDAYKLFTSSWTVFSDARTKEDIRNYEPGLAEILKLRTVRYRHRDGFHETTRAQEGFGFIAQEVQEVIPEAVHRGKDGYLLLNVDPIHWAGINAIKQLHQIIEDQQSENQRLQERLDRVEAALRTRRITP